MLFVSSSNMFFIVLNVSSGHSSPPSRKKRPKHHFMETRLFPIPLTPQRDVPVISEQIDTIFRSMGDVIWTDERMLSCGMSLASCGIAYAFRYLDAAIRGGMAFGFSEVESSRAVLSTMEGALAILKQGGTTPRQEILKVATPGGYTARGLQTMDDKGFDDAVHSALRSSAG